MFPNVRSVLVEKHDMIIALHLGPCITNFGHSTSTEPTTFDAGTLLQGKNEVSSLTLSLSLMERHNFTGLDNVRWDAIHIKSPPSTN